MNNKDKFQWRERWVHCIKELTSLELQKSSWLDLDSSNPHWSYTEFMCSYFDDLVIDYNYKYQLEKGWILLEELDIIKDWHEALDKYNPPKNNPYDHESILKDKNWLAILELGVTAKSNLAEILSEKERMILTGQEYF